MTTPPDFGGREIEEGLEEDLGVPRAEHQNLTGRDQDALVQDNEAHAPGNVCELCGTVITAGQDVRRMADGHWIHEICPPHPPHAGAPGDQTTAETEQAG